MKAESVRFEQVTKRFGSVVAVNRLTLHIQPGEFMVLVGPSGCGKTTASRMLAGLEDPPEGAIYIGDRCVNEISPRDHDVAMVFQNYALYPHMRVSEPLPAVVDVIEPHGDRNDMHLVIDRVSMIAQLSARVKANEGDTLPIHLHLEYLHLFETPSPGNPCTREVAE